MQKKNIRRNVVLLLAVLLALCFGCTVQAETDHKHEKGDWETEEILDDGKELQKKVLNCGKVMGERIIETNKGHVAEPETGRFWRNLPVQKKGKKVKRCKVCGEICEESSIEKLDHEPGDWEVEREPSCSGNGEKVRVERYVIRCVIQNP